MMLVALTLTPLAARAQATPPLTAEEEISVDEIGEFVRSTAQRYRMVAPLAVSIVPWVGNPSLPQYASSPAVYVRGALFLNRRLLRASNRDLVIATALAYEILRTPETATSLAARDRLRTQLALDGNAKAVEILVEVKGLSEEAALERMYESLLAQHRAAVTSGLPTPPGQPPPCEAIADLRRRYPASRERFAGRECAPA
jgi:hypothetical protein